MLKKVLSAFLVMAIAVASSAVVFADSGNDTQIASSEAECIVPVDTDDIDCGKLKNHLVFSTPESEFVYAAKDGKVTFAEYNKSAGYEVRIQHDDGFTSVYFHLNKTYFRENTIEVGSKILAGDIVGKTGDSGYAKGNVCGFALLETDAINASNDAKNIKTNLYLDVKEVNKFLHLDI